MLSIGLQNSKNLKKNLMDGDREFLLLSTTIRCDWCKSVKHIFLHISLGFGFPHKYPAK